ncbi:Dipeptidyl aminopeptidase/acylaminoacyl peptidase [Microbacterium sp. ru370.1]|uniref:S9 family peptidase n=1 Tax=unclassified Microbacterium TaxID=2609290 RepID=UPI00088EC58A|nr:MULTISPECIES: prolyl oligopeptidase family serine peptidase [unclassified Microbacterium]SDO58570.1 Dipeptidyl aminopeptidase/acylaminoacyl peptidase [Microbacterium sp. ru370.1]SIT85808.1 Dipeptidyl aminopeptidase/acylaminoacyl peptidase [Microbacterium sp. RU1D]
MADTLPYGSWPSPITPESVAQASPRVDGARLVGDEVWWGESIPHEAGRVAVKRRRVDGSVETVLPAPANARSAVHEYGGGAWTASDDGELYYVEKTDQRVYALRPGGIARALTPADEAVRHGGLRWEHGVLLAIRETHGTSRVPHRAIVRIPLDGDVDVLAEGSDFLAQPALSPDGRRLAWVAWNHPDMPWDATVLRVADLETGSVRDIAGGDRRAPLQPVWIADDELLYADDPDGRWNLFHRLLDGDAQPLAPAHADTGGGLWVLGTRWFGAADDGRVVAVRTNGADEIVEIAPSGVRPIDVPVVAGAAIDDVGGSRALVSGSDAGGRSGLWLVDLDSGRVDLVTGGAGAWGDEWMPAARALTTDGPHGPVHAFAYAPTNPEVSPAAGERPPYVVLVHGGPTSHVGPAPSAKTAFFTSRGIGVLDVNYGGSTGYGRAYRDRLKGQWGVVDVDDVAAAASALADAGLADPERLAIAGGSAGGWTVLAAVTRTEVFAAGISRYGVGDARALAEDTHDFEARYLDGLIGPLPEAESVYVERSPLGRPELFRVPLLILQGAEDRVVPPSQAEAIRDALTAHGVPHAYVLYEGEGHGFRRSETVIDSLERELGFLGAVFGFETPGVPALELD